MAESDRKRYFAAAHAMQSGVALSMTREEHSSANGDSSPKHLRVGVNSAMCDHAGLVSLLLAKGILTIDEYERAIADEMEAEVARYRERLRLPDNVNLA